MRNFIAALVLGTSLAVGTQAFADEMSRDVTIYKNPQCGCCENYASYLRENGFTVAVEPTHDLVAMSRLAGVPEEFQGCHLALVDGYVVSGHVPVEMVERVLEERPEITGVTLPGMPMGSPGMGGTKTEPFTVYQVVAGAVEIYAVE